MPEPKQENPKPSEERSTKETSPQDLKEVAAGVPVPRHRASIDPETGPSEFQRDPP